MRHNNESSHQTVVWEGEKKPQKLYTFVSTKNQFA